MRAYAAHVPVVTFSMAKGRGADVWPERMRFSLWETEVVVQTPVGALQIITPLIARHNVPNILAAVAVGLAVTVDGEPIPLKVRLIWLNCEELRTSESVCQIREPQPLHVQRATPLIGRHTVPNRDQNHPELCCAPCRQLCRA